MHVSRFALLAAVLPFTLGEPKQPPFSNSTEVPLHFGVVLFPHFQALDVYGPLDILNFLHMIYSNQTKGATLQVFSKTMDPVSTAMMASGFGESTVPMMAFDDYLASRNMTADGDQSGSDTESCDCSDGHVDHTVKKRAMRFGTRHEGDDGMPSMSTTTAPGKIDVLIFPGGGGTRKDMTAEIAFVKAVYPDVQYIISVCTGASILARAGILDNRNATTNKKAWEFVLSTGPKVKWVPTARWVTDGNIWTTSGIAAGQDGTFAFVSHVYGDDVAQYLADSLEYNRMTDQHFDPFGKIWDVPGAT